MLKRRAINMILPMFLFMISGYLYINKVPLIYKTYGIDKSLIELDAGNKDDAYLVENLRKTYNNSEIVGYLEIPGTDFERIITKGSNNEKYLSRNAYGKKDILGNPFLDYRVDINNDNKILIYGHNSKTLDAPFKYLENYYDYEFFQNHKYITIAATEEKITYQIFSVYIETKDWSYMNIDFKSSTEWLNHLTKLKKKSMYDTGVDVSEYDKVLILQTCSHKKEFQKFKNKYLLIIAREVE